MVTISEVQYCETDHLLEQAIFDRRYEYNQYMI